ncbi:MAG: type II toxin-antitoxin system VapB family antitoxin [Magnetospirillum sp. WYHS-4]
MSPNIKNEKTRRLAGELDRLTGETMTQAAQHQGIDLADRLLAIGAAVVPR